MIAVRRTTGWGALCAIAALTAAPALADSPRDLLTQACFVDRDKGQALRHVATAHDEAAAALVQSPGDREAMLVSAIATGYRAKLTGSRSEALAARHQFEALVARDPGNAEAQAALGAWHIGAIYKLGRLMGRATLGAQRAVGLAALDRSVAIGGNRAMFAGLAGLLRLELDPADPRARALVAAAARGATPTALDRIMRRSATLMLATLASGDHDAIQATAARLLPLGWADAA